MSLLTHMQICGTSQSGFEEKKYRIYHQTHLEHVVGLLPHTISKAETVKNLQTSALEAIRLTAKDLGVPLVDDSGLHTAVCHPCCRHEPVLCQSKKVPARIASPWPWPPSLSTYPAGPAPIISLIPISSEPRSKGYEGHGLLHIDLGVG